MFGSLTLVAVLLFWLLVFFGAQVVGMLLGRLEVGTGAGFLRRSRFLEGGRNLTFVAPDAGKRHVRVLPG